jgi:hypothetical protein
VDGLSSAADLRGRDVAGDQMAADICEALNAGIELEEYLCLRGMGDEHANILEVSAQGAPERGFPVAQYLDLRVHGICAKNALEVLAQTDVSANSDYTSLLSAGTTHNDAIEILCVSGWRRMLLGIYLNARCDGVDHHGAMILADCGMDGLAFDTFVQNGTSGHDILGGLSSGMDIRDYHACVMAGIPHHEALEGHLAGIETARYIRGRFVFGHAGVLEYCTPRRWDYAIACVIWGWVGLRRRGRLIPT